MSSDREAALRSAEKALRLGKLEQAIAEYGAIVERQPRDFNSANTLGDLYVRAGRTGDAVAQYARIAEHFLDEGFLPKASALFKKILKIRPDDEQALLRLGQIAGRQGLLADARASMQAVAAKRRARGDAAGAEDILIALADLDAGDVEGRVQAGRILSRRGQGADAAGRLRELALDLLEKDRADEAIDVLRETVHLVPSDRLARRQLVELLNDLGQGAEAEVYLTRDVAGDDPVMLLLLAKAELESGRLDEGRDDIRRALAHDAGRADLLLFIRQLAPRQPAAAFIAAEALADAAIARGRVPEAVDTLSRFLEAAPGHVAAGLRLVEICLEHGLDQMVSRAQAALADAYLAAGDPESARVIAEDLAAADPADDAARRRLARAREACGAAASDAPVVAAPPAPAMPAESDAALIARLLDEEASRDTTAEARVEPEIDLTATLDALDDGASAAASEGAPLDDVFDGFRHRARAEDQHRAEAAYEEAELAGALGQIDDAERLYAEAARAPLFRFRAACAMARLLRQEGRAADAIEWLERASEAAPPDAAARFSVLYDLGDMLEGQGESARALAVFMELNAEAGDYRGIAARVERLARAEIGG